MLTGGNVWLNVLIAMLINIPINMMLQYFSTRYAAHVRSEAMGVIGIKFPRLPAAWLENQRTGELISTCTTDVDLYLKWAQWGFSTLVQKGAYYIGAICYALSQNVKLTLIAFPVAILLVPLFNRITKPLQSITNSQRAQAANTMTQMQEVLADPEQIKAYSLETAMKRRVGTALDEQMRAQQKGGVYLGISQSLGNISSYLPGFVVAAVGVVLWYWRTDA